MPKRAGRKQPMPLQDRGIARYPFVILGLLGFLSLAVLRWQSDGDRGPGTTHPVYTFKVIQKYPHDRRAFTQGLLFDQTGDLLESTGMYRRTQVRRVDLTTGKVKEKNIAADSAFGEGLALWKGRLLQLDWKKSTGVVYNASTLEKIGILRHPYKDGWGLTNSPRGDEDQLVMTDNGHKLLYVRVHEHVGSSDLSLQESSFVPVQDRGRLVTMVNELERVDEKVYANVFGKDCVAIIASDGAVESWIDLRGLLKAGEVPDRRGHNVLNGVAFRPQKPNRLFVTGKEWPWLFEIELVPSDLSLNEARRMCIPTMNVFNGWVAPSSHAGNHKRGQ